MKTLSRTLLVVCSFALVSCGDSHEKIMKDQIGWMEDLTEVIEGVSEGDISSSEAAAKIEKLGEKADKLAERRSELDQELTPEEARGLTEKYGEESSEAFKNYMSAVQELMTSGRATGELIAAITNMNPGRSADARAIEDASERFLESLGK